MNRPPKDAGRQLGRREQILEELVGIYASEGFAHLSLEELTARLHCSRSTIYSLGRSRPLLDVTVIQHLFQKARGRVIALSAREQEATDRLRVFLQALPAEAGRVSRACFRDMMSSPATSLAYHDSINETVEVIRTLIDEGITSGQFRPVHGAFVGETIAAIVRDIEWGDIRERTGLSHEEAYAEMSSLMLGALANTQDPVH